MRAILTQPPMHGHSQPPRRSPPKSVCAEMLGVAGEHGDASGASHSENTDEGHHSNVLQQPTSEKWRAEASLSPVSMATRTTWRLFSCPFHRPACRSVTARRLCSSRVSCSRKTVERFSFSYHSSLDPQ